jgi:hypothetical protein
MAWPILGNPPSRPVEGMTARGSCNMPFCNLKAVVRRAGQRNVRHAPGSHIVGAAVVVLVDVGIAAVAEGQGLNGACRVGCVA